MREISFYRKGILCAALALAFVVPLNENVNAASSSLQAFEYQAYPKPAVKPQICTKIEVKNETYIDKKQAAAAALGLYLGIRQATAPINVQDNEILCV